MAVLTEAFLRKEWKNNKISTFRVNKGDVITPSAKEFLKEKNIELVEAEASSDKAEQREPNPLWEEKATSMAENNPKRYKDFHTGVHYGEKPEAMTQISGNLLVFKDDPRIIFRGRIDALEAEVLRAMMIMESLHEPELKEGLRDIYLHLRKIMRAEVLGEALADFEMLHKDHEAIRRITHSPKKYFSGGHLILTGEERPAVLHLNVIRTRVREVEIAAVQAFRRKNKVEREDIVESLNRMSSAIYYLMLKAAYQ